MKTIQPHMCRGLCTRRSVRFIAFVIGLALLLLPALRVRGAVVIHTTDRAGKTEQLAASELKRYLSKLYPNEQFVAQHGGKTPAGMQIVRLGTPETLPEQVKTTGALRLKGRESYVVYTVTNQDNKEGVVLGADPAGVMYGVYGLLEKLGFGFYVSTDTCPKPRTSAFTFVDWNLDDHPLTPIRLVFNWHNFLSGCTGWDIAQWESWIVQSQKMGFNMVMVHAYGNNPMFTFRFQGFKKPVGFLATTRRGRDWGNEHLNDVRRIPGGDVFESAEFGCRAALVPPKQRVEAAQMLMKKVFAFAQDRAMQVCFALDVDTESVLPQDMILSLPRECRMFNDRIWLPRPDTDDGYQFYKAQVESLLRLYPQIDMLAIWRRSTGLEWKRLKLSQMPKSWQQEYRAYVKNRPAAEKIEQGLLGFALNKVVDAFRRALDELGRPDVRIGMGSWGHSWVPAAAEFLPEEVTLMPLDSSYIRYRDGSFLERDDWMKVLATAKSRVLPVIWAHHDDGEYIGRPIHPHANLQSKLAKLNARGFGIIHWMTRPLDPYFKNQQNQVWARTQNQPYRDTCRAMAGHWFGQSHAEELGDYLLRWATDAPIFGRVTTDHFFLAREGIPDAKKAIAAGGERTERLKQVKTEDMTADQLQRLKYFEALESLLISFCEVQELAYQPAKKAVLAGRFDDAKRLLEQQDPAKTIRQLSHLSTMAGGNRGEQAMVASLGTRWITDYKTLRQVVGLEPIRINFGPTSHERLAQGVGHYTFMIDEHGNYWSVWGQQETGRKSVAIKPAVDRQNAELDREVLQSGIVVDSSTTIPVVPLVARLSGSSYYSGVPKEVMPGNYRLTLYLVAQEPESVVNIKLDTAFSRVAPPTVYRLSAVAGHRYLRLHCRGNNENAWNSICEVRCAALRRDAGVTASAAEDGCEANLAIDGKQTTRWAVSGRDQWIQFVLDPKKPLEQLEIQWYNGDRRTANFDFLVSNDGQTWTKLACQPGGPHEPVRRPESHRVDLSQHAGGNSRLVTLKYPIQLQRSGTVNVTLVPEKGKPIICGAVLRTETGGRMTQ